MILSDPGRTPYDLQFRVAGFPVQVHPLFWLVALIFGLVFWQGYVDYGPIPVMAAIFLGVMFAAILVHELGHAFAFRFFGSGARVVLYAMGGLAIPDDQTAWFIRKTQRTTLEQVVISAAGPAAGFILAVLVVGIVFAAGGAVHFESPITIVHGGGSGFQLGPWNVDFNVFFWSVELIRGEHLGNTIAEQPRLFFLFVLIESALVTNIFWGLINLVPVFPLDGGQISRALFLQFDGANGLRKSLWLSVFAGGALALIGVLNGRIMIVLLFASMAFSSWQMLQQIDRGGWGGGSSW